MVGERIKRSGYGGGLSLTVVDLFAGTLLAVFVIFVIYVWLHRDPVPRCYYRFQNHVNMVFERQPDAFYDRPEFRFLRVRLVLNDSWLSFDPCLWVLSEEKQIQLRSFFEELITEDYRSCIESVRIEGHADTIRFSLANCVRTHPNYARELRRVGPWADNTQLSQNRARTVFETLKVLPFVDEMWSDHKIHIGGYGDSWPLVGERESPLNRRVEIHLKFFEASD